MREIEKRETESQQKTRYKKGKKKKKRVMHENA